MISASGPSRRTTRYLPRRCTWVTLRPSSSSVNSFLFLCRRTERVPVTSTDLIFLPTISLSRSRRNTSTSGSSGIVVSLLPRLFLESGPRHPCGRLLGLLLRTSFAFPVQAVGHVDSREEVFGVIGSFVSHHVTRTPERARRSDLLEASLVVAAAGTGRGFGDAVLQAAQHDIARDREAEVEVDRRDHGFERVGEDRLLRPAAGRVLTLAEQE